MSNEIEDKIKELNAKKSKICEQLAIMLSDASKDIMKCAKSGEFVIVDEMFEDTKIPLYDYINVLTDQIFSKKLMYLSVNKLLYNIKNKQSEEDA